MKTPSFVFALFAVSLVSARAAVSEPIPSVKSVASAIETVANVPKPERPSLELDFPGGSVAQFVEAASANSHRSFSLIGDKAYQEISLPPMRLRGAELNSLAMALDPYLRPHGVRISASFGNIFSLAKSTTIPGSSSATPTFQAFQLAPYLATASVEAIVSAVTTAWENEPAHVTKPVTFKYHDATTLLFVYGPPEAIAVANVVIAQINPVVSARQRNESYAAAGQSSFPDAAMRVAPDRNPAAEQARLIQVTEEVKRRRLARDGAAAEPAVAAPPEKK